MTYEINNTPRIGFLGVRQNGSTIGSNNTISGHALPEILVITTYPPRQCGIATYSEDLIAALNNKYEHSFRMSICALETNTEHHAYGADVKFTLNTDDGNDFRTVARRINSDPAIRIVLIQHEFGLFSKNEYQFNAFLDQILKPIILVFHTILPNPGETLKEQVQYIAGIAQCVIVMTHSSANILEKEYAIESDKVALIPHGTHLVRHIDKSWLKRKYKLTGRKVLSTFGLLSSGKSIETTLRALPAIVNKDQSVIFLIIGKTHPTIIQNEGEQYREMLKVLVDELNLTNHVRFVNQFLPLPELLEYLQLTDIYLFTSTDPNQAVSGTFSYAISCGCPIISTPIPHAREVLDNDTGIIVDFNNPEQLAVAVNDLLGDEQRRLSLVSNSLHRMASTAWENSAIAHAKLFEQNSIIPIMLNFRMPEINLDHLNKMTTGFGIIQFSRFNTPDLATGYTLDDNARALIAMCQHYELTRKNESLVFIVIYLSFIKYCQQADGSFLNYVDENEQFTQQNSDTNLDDANGRAFWALGVLVSMSAILPVQMVDAAKSIIRKGLANTSDIHSPRAMAFIIKGMYYCSLGADRNDQFYNRKLTTLLADRLVQMYAHEACHGWHWFEDCLTYGNSVISEAMLCAWLCTGDEIYREIAKTSFDFLLSKTFEGNRLRAISNQCWLRRGEENSQALPGGEQPIEIAYAVNALEKFAAEFGTQDYRDKLQGAFNWFLGNNHLNQIVYNPCTGGCYDGLEATSVNLNQGAESTVSYLIARLTIEKANKMDSAQRAFVYDEPLSLQYAANG